MISKHEGGAGLHGPIIQESTGWRFMHPREGAALVAIPRNFYMSHLFAEAWVRIGNAIPVTLTILGAGRVQSAAHAIQNI
eukprot:11070574-Karenia_brevis.AAC.1